MSFVKPVCKKNRKNLELSGNRLQYLGDANAIDGQDGQNAEEMDLDMYICLYLNYAQSYVPFSLLGIFCFRRIVREVRHGPSGPSITVAAAV